MRGRPRLSRDRRSRSAAPPALDLTPVAEVPWYDRDV